VSAGFGMSYAGAEIIKTISKPLKFLDLQVSADLDAEISNSKAGRLRLGLWELEHCRDKERLGLGKWQACMNL